MGEIVELNLVLSDWESLNVLTSTYVGSQLTIQNEGSNWFILSESNIKPERTSRKGVSVTSLYQNSPIKFIEKGSNEIWVRPLNYGSLIQLTVQEV